MSSMISSTNDDFPLPPALLPSHLLSRFPPDGFSVTSVASLSSLAWFFFLFFLPLFFLSIATAEKRKKRKKAATNSHPAGLRPPVLVLNFVPSGKASLAMPASVRQFSSLKPFKVTSVKPVHPANASFSMLVTVFGISSLVIPTALRLRVRSPSIVRPRKPRETGGWFFTHKAPRLIVTTDDFSRFTPSRLLQPLKASLSIMVTLAGHVNVVSSVLP